MVDGTRIDQIVAVLRQRSDAEISDALGEVLERFYSWQAPNGEVLVFQGATISVHAHVRLLQLTDVLFVLEQQGLIQVTGG